MENMFMTIFCALIFVGTLMSICKYIYQHITKKDGGNQHVNLLSFIIAIIGFVYSVRHFYNYNKSDDQ